MQSKGLEKSKSNDYIDLFLDPVRFFSFITGFHPTEYQQKILEDESQYVTIRASRQSGKTEVIAVKVLWHCLLNPDFQTLILAPTLRQSSIVFNKIDMYLLKNSFLRSLAKVHSRSYIQFDNGSEIYNLPGSSGDTIRGYSPKFVVVDEAAYIKDEVYTALEPSLAVTNGKIVLISSPFGKQGRFYESHTRLDYYSRYHVSYEDCPFINKDYIERERQNKTEMEFQQEYQADFVEEADTYFTISLIKSCMTEITQETEAQTEFDYYLGVDPAWHGTDEAVYIVSKYKKDSNKVTAGVHFEATSKKPLTDVMGRVQELNKRFKFKRIYFDATGLGAGVSDFLAEAGLPIQEFIFTQQNKVELYSNLKRLFEQKKIEIPDEPKLIWQLAELQYQYTSNGSMSLHHPDKANAHDDYPDALVLSVWFMEENKNRGTFIVLDLDKKDENQTGWR